MAPQLYDGKVLISTIPGSCEELLPAPAPCGIVYSLNAEDRDDVWKFSTVKDGSKLFGNPKVNSGGGLWYPPAVDSQGRVFHLVSPIRRRCTRTRRSSRTARAARVRISTRTRSSRSTARPASCSGIRQVTPHDVRDYDLQVARDRSTTLPINGVQTEVVIVAGKMGKVVTPTAPTTASACGRARVGRSPNDTGRCSLKPRQVCLRATWRRRDADGPRSGNRLFVPWVDLCSQAQRTAPRWINLTNLRRARGGLAAIDAGDRQVVWQHKLPSMDFRRGDASPTTSSSPATYAGTIYAFDTQTGKTLWTTQAPAGINSFRRSTKDMLIIGAGASRRSQEAAVTDHRLLAATHLRASAKTQAAPTSTTGSAATGSRWAVGERARRRRSRSRAASSSSGSRPKSIAKPGKVTFVFTNVGHVAHDFEINGKQTPLIQPGTDGEARGRVQKKGKYPYLAPVPGHAEAGMKGAFTVR